MAVNKIYFKKSNLSGKVPALSSISSSELAINIADGRIFLKQTPVPGNATLDKIVTFLSSEEYPYTLDPSFFTVNTVFGNNITFQAYGTTLGGLNNENYGATATIVNGEINKVYSDFAFIGTGYNNSIYLSGAYSSILNGENNTIALSGNHSSILGGSNNRIDHENSFILGSNITSHSPNFTYVNNISASGIIYGSGSGLTDISSMIMTAQVKNADTVTLTRGTVVYTFGATGDVMSVKRASNAGDPTSSKTLGLINETIAPNQIGSATLAGRMDRLPLDHPYVDGDILWLGNTPGTFTRTKPSAPEHGVYLGVVERANAGNGIAYIKVQNGYEIDELHDVSITSVSAGDVLRRNNSNTLWQNTNDGVKWDSVYTSFSASSASFYQTLSFNETTSDLTITNGNTVSLSALNGGISGSTTTQEISVIATSQGLYKDGDKISAGTSFETILINMLKTSVPPTYTIPTLSVAYGSPTVVDTYEVGFTISSFTITPTFTSNDSGGLIGYTYYKGGSNLGSGPAKLIDSFQINTATTLQVEANYSQGPIKNDNLGTPYPTGRINADTLTNTVTLNVLYPYFWGKSSTQPTAASIASAIQSGTANKVLASASGTISITYNANGEYIWFAHTAAQTEKTKWYVTALNNGSIGNGQAINLPVTQSVNSPNGYWSGVNFKIYISSGKQQTTGAFEYRNS